ncbi:HET-domain-containing protein [Stipitochalara longipes BDJ]|nr:HET-domain-containing protein [Stipitochalara longipes BDJ]
MSDPETSGQAIPEPKSPGPGLRPPEGRLDKHSRTHSGAARQRILKATNTLTDALDRKNTYAYKNIDCDNQIRVLKVFPPEPGAKTKILCCLVPCPLLGQGVQQTSHLSSLIQYEALSYNWGVEEPENKVYIFGTPEAYDEWRKINKTGALLEHLVSHMLIRNNLRDALEQLRSPKNTVNLWADALCINQNNIEERTAQVARMHDVYTQAKKVHIWLGKGDATENQKTFDFLRKILNLQELEALVQRLENKGQSGDNQTWKKDKADCKRTIDLMRAKWFSRRWIIQELALATMPHVRRGSQEMPWQDFADAIALFMTKYETIRRAFGPGPQDYSAALNSDEHHIMALDARALGANALVTATSNLFRRSNEGKILQRLLSLELLVSSMLLAFEAADPKDTIFAVLQIAKDLPENNQQVLTSSETHSTFKQYLVPLFGIAIWSLWKSNAHTLLLPSRAKQIPTFDLAPRLPVTSTAISARHSLIGFIDYCILVVSVFLVWLFSRLFLDLLIKLSTFLTRFLSRGSHPPKALDKRIEANYRKCFRDVCADFIEYCIERSNSLDILCRHWAPEFKPSPHTGMVDMPSWILPITGDAFGGPQQSQKGRANGDSFVGGSERIGPYTASGKIPPLFEFGKSNTPEKSPTADVTQEPGGYTQLPLGHKRELPPRFNGTLKVKGFQLGTIGQTAPIAGGVITRPALELCGWKKGAGTKDIDQVWRILVANRGPSGTNPPNWYRRACQACLDWYDKEPEDTFNTHKLKDISGTPAGKVEFLDRVQQVVWNRNIISIRDTNHRKLIGIAPQASQKSDIICIFFGCSVPVVLEPQLNGTYRFVGECYVHGFMDGEAVDPIPSGTKEVWFKLI